MDFPGSVSPAEVPPGPGVYALYSAGILVYVGQTNDMKRRVPEHRKYGRVFDRVAVIPLPDPVERAALEASFIQKFSPRYNGEMASLMSEEAKIKRRLRRKAWRLKYPDKERAGVNMRHRRWRARAA